MKTKNQITRARKVIIVIFLLVGVCFSDFGAGNLFSVRAQDAEPATTETPIVSGNAIPQDKNIIDYVPGEIIIKLRPNVEVNIRSQATNSSPLNEKLIELNVTKMASLYYDDNLNIGEISSLPIDPILKRYYKLEIPIDSDVLTFCDQFMEIPDVEFAIPNYIAHIDQAPNDPNYLNSNQWALNKLNLPAAWDITTGASSIVVAVLDTGLDVTHPDVGSKNTYTGKDIYNNDFGIQDDNGHGTEVSGVIAANTNNGQGVAGMSWGARIMPVKVCGSGGDCPSDVVMNGIRWAKDNGAKIINMSLLTGSSGFGQLMWQDAIDYAYDNNNGVVIIASAGNDREYLDLSNAPYYAPAELNHVIVVGAVNKIDEDCRPNILGYAANCYWYANAGTGYGPALDVVAPGSADIWTTELGGGYTSSFGGTSAAAPFVSGVAALMLSINPDLAPDQVENIIKQSAVPLDPYAENHPNYSFGWGRIDASEAVKAVPPPPLSSVALLVNVNPSGAGTVSVNPSPNSGSGYVPGTVIQITANPNSGYRFNSWSGDIASANNPTSFTINGNMSVTANFSLISNNDTTPPTTGWNSPANGSTIGNRSVNLSAWAQDNAGGSGINRVSFSAKYNGQWVGLATIYNSPYTFNWDFCQTGVPDNVGDIELGLEAVDNNGNKYVYSEHYTNFHITKSYACGIASSQWSVDYWMNKYLAGYVNWHNNEDGPYIFRDWGDNGPGGGIPVNEWSARFVRTVSFLGGDYRFHCQHDDGCKIFIDGQERVNGWWDSSFDGHDWGGYISAGTHEVKVEYYDNQGGARLEAWWQGPGFLPRDENCDSNPTQWCGEYWGNLGWSGTPAIRRVEGEILNHDWGTDSPAATFLSDNFSARWTRHQYFAAGQYRFHLTHDDAGKLFIDGQQVIGNDNCCSEDIKDVYLTEGDHILKVEMNERGGAANVRLWWDTLVVCYALNTSVTPVSSGSVNSSPAPNCGSSMYTSGTPVSLTASPSGGYSFSYWSGDVGGTSNPTNIIMNSNKTVVANFNPGPAAFNKISPSNGATGQSTSPTLTWETSTGATSYEYCYDTTNDNACSTWTSNGAFTSKALSGLSASTTYYWHVRAVNTGGTTYSNASATTFWSFTTATNPPGAFNKSAPLNGATSQSTSPTLSWGSSSGATSYEYCYDTTNDNACSTWTSNGTSTSKGLSGLSASTTYYWHVRANGSGTTYSNGSSTAYWSFTTAASTPVQATQVWTSDGNWNPKTSFTPNNPIQWVITVENTTGGDVQADLIYVVKSPSGAVITNWQGTVTVSAGTWDWGLPGTIPTSGGTYTFIGSVTYQGVTTTRSVTYVVNAPIQTFSDVPPTHPYYQYIEVLYANGLTNGCNASPLLYCPSMIMNRAQIAKFFMTVQFGGSYLPPANTPLVFQDNWSNNPWAQIWANDMYAKGLTNGCNASPLLYCPDVQIPREQVAKFGLAIKYGSAYLPPPASGMLFADMTNLSYWATAWAEQAYLEGLVPACGTDAVSGKPKFCPLDKVDRGFAAFVIVTATGLLGP